MKHIILTLLLSFLLTPLAYAQDNDEKSDVSAPSSGEQIIYDPDLDPYGPADSAPQPDDQKTESDTK